MIRWSSCFDGLGGHAVVGPDRGTVLHEDCFGEHGRCVVLGCRGIVRLGPRIEVAPRPRLFLDDPSTTPEAAISLLPRR